MGFRLRMPTAQLCCHTGLTQISTLIHRKPFHVKLTSHKRDLADFPLSTIWFSVMRFFQVSEDPKEPAPEVESPPPMQD